MMDKKEEPQLTYEEIIELRAQEKEFKKRGASKAPGIFCGRCSRDWRASVPRETYIVKGVVGAYKGQCP